MEQNLYFSNALLTSQFSTVHVDTGSGNLMDVAVSDGNSVVRTIAYPSREPSV